MERTAVVVAVAAEDVDYTATAATEGRGSGCMLLWVSRGEGCRWCGVGARLGRLANTVGEAHSALDRRLRCRRS